MPAVNKLAATVQPAFVWTLFHLFVMAYEEPTLRRRYGDSYRDYQRRVGRWWPPPIRVILIAGLTAAALDIAAAFGFYGLRGVSPVRILQSIASGVMGSAAFEGGAPTAVLGGCLHILIALAVATVFFVFSRRFAFLVRRPVVSGTSYGAVVYLVMNHVVLPLSSVPKRPFSVGTAIVMVVIHIACIGLPIALAVRRYSVQPEVRA